MIFMCFKVMFLLYKIKLKITKIILFTKKRITDILKRKTIIFLGEGFMKLELHNGSLLLSIEVKNDQEAEDLVRKTHFESDIHKWILFCEKKLPRCVWERPRGSLVMPKITQRTTKFIEV